jgi:uncharacterized lipoprotein YbaY
VRLCNISYADEPARVLAEHVERGLRFDPQHDAGLTFALSGPPPDPQARYIVQVHVDLDGDGAISHGDFVTMQSYPVLTLGHPHEIAVVVRQVE